MLKKIIAVILALVMVVSIFYVVPFSVSAKNKDTVTVYFSPTVWNGNRNWNRYFIVYSTDEIVSSKVSNWPGEEMEFVGIDSNGEALYKFDIPANCKHILFNNGVKKNLSIINATVQAETPDIVIPDNAKDVTYYLDDFDVVGWNTYVFTTEMISVSYYENYYFTTNTIPNNTIPIGEISKIAVSKEENNTQGDYYSGENNIEWISDNPDVLRIHSKNDFVSTVNVEGLKYGTSMLHFIVNGEEKACEEITVLMPIDKMIGSYSDYIHDNATLTTLKNAIKIPNNITSHYSLGDYTRVAFFTMLGEDLGFKTAYKQYKGVFYEGRTREEEALYKTTKQILSSYFELDESFSSSISGFKSDWKQVKNVVDIAKKAKDTEGVKSVLYKYLPSLFNIPVESVDGLFEDISSTASNISDAAEIAEIMVTALTLARFDKECVESMLQTLPKSSYAYKGLKLIYDDMNQDIVVYVTTTYASEKMYGTVTSLIADGIFELSHLTALKYIGAAVSVAYSLTGGTTVDDYYMCIYSQRIAKDLFDSLRTTKDSSDLQTVFELCKYATKLSLNNGIKVAGDDSYYNSQKKSAAIYISKVDFLTYDIFVLDCQKEIFTRLETLQAKKEEFNGKIVSFISKLKDIIAPISSDVTDFISQESPVLVIPSIIDATPVKGIDSEAFIDVADYQTIILPDSIIELRERSFKNCSASTIMLGDDVEVIGNEAFKDCSQLSDIILPTKLKSIGENAFSNCSSVCSLTISKNVQTVGAKAFENCTSLENIYFENPYTEIEEDALNGCAQSLVVYGYSGSDSELIAKANGFEFVDLGKYLKSVSIETPAQQNVFYYGTEVSLEGLSLRVEFYDGTQEIIDDGFVVSYDSQKIGVQEVSIHCLNLEIPYQIEIIDVKATEIDVDNSDVRLSPGNSIKLNVQVLPQNSSNSEYIVTSSNESIAYEKDGYINVENFGYATISISTLDGSLTKTVPVYGINCLYFNTSNSKDIQTTSLKVPKSGTYDLAIKNSVNASIRILDESETEVTASINGELSAYLEEGKTYTIEGSSQQTTSDFFYVYIYCPDWDESETYMTIENENDTLSIFQYVGTEKNVVVPATIDNRTVTLFHDAFADNNYIESVEIPETITAISYDAFLSCQNLKNVIIEDGVKEIQRTAFANCASLEKIVIPASIESLGEYAFGNCKSLTSVTIMNDNMVIPQMSIGYYDAPTDEEYISQLLKVDDLTIYGLADSTAEVYAREHGFKFVDINEAPSEPDFRLGDVDSDGKVSIVDATAIQRHLAEISMLTEQQLACADTDKDGKVTILDATTIQRFLAELIPEL
ncbi:MAG: hypothetical protein E7513_06865 [Ruminococcaceae bacterium]|nr:hypothetical protein [Oscillospiraceae bacterium]